MAEKEKNAEEKQKPENGKKAGDKKTAEPEETKAGKPPLNLIVFALLVVLVLGGGAFAWKSGMLNKMIGGGENAKVEKKIKKIEKPDIGTIYPMESFIVNLMDPMGKRYLKVKIALELTNEESTSEVDKRLPQFRDGILTLLSSKTFKEINDLSGKYQLRAEILGMLNGYMKTGRVRNVYFTEFIVQ
jgi:flagellar protein FliL